mmetsp:Transcript_57530/g.132618  ORF Transcript_57530/g.132618 Transcript_57530/m.132618 type:complete len:685 (-) Transcript_57530:51-2105(-)|eukprot:CAMPEP_0204319732 /NCGR_PEP_ID=MMETSP0469-20131031/7256_1 /ASSEMBLY_ACC=CAM_ASM_000384 /TAXON_ID=2969 /ORGANISM="Oxyrrhis marina" /LENGTH=684 /DNA_ID=CAMNT_0051300937 /DNA_START=84 /DNA_END=2138 /DNA_ORIENTATION=+
MRAFLALLWLAAAFTASPVSRVVNLIREMRAKIVADEKAEQQVYDRYACWCEKTTTRKAKDIEDARTKIGELGSEISAKKGKLATLGAALQGLMEGIEDNEIEMHNATTLRARQNAAFQHEKSELSEAIESLEHGLHVMTGKPTSADLVAVANQLRQAVEASPNPLPTAQAESVHKILSQVSLAQTGSKYDPQYKMIQGILEAVHETLKENLETLVGEEKTQQETYEGFMDTKTTELVDDRATILRKHGNSADATDALTLAAADLAATQQQLEDDEQFFADSKTACEEKATEWETRQSERVDELEAIDNAIDILDSPENRALFGHAYTTFVSISEVSRGVVNSTARVAALLTKKAQQLKSAILARAAVAVKTHGAFDAVLEDIDTMIETLKTQEQTDITDRDACKVDMKTEREKFQDHSYLVEKITNTLKKLTTKKEKLETDVEETSQAITEQEDMMQEAMDQRNASTARFLQSKSDDEDAVDLLQQALEALEGYYNNTNSSFLQIASQPLGRQSPFLTAADIKAPEFKVSKDQAPEAKFSKTGEHKQESNGILAMLRQITQNLQIEIADSEKAEEEEIAAYDKQRADDEATLQSLRDRKSDLQGEISSTEGKIGTKETDKTGEEGDRDSASTALENLKPGCDWLLGAFEKRRALRKEETEGLMEAKSLLSGGDIGGGTFLQRK